ncbi:EamA family transporter [Aquimarina hainanensis]|uniref:EamA family transporter n=1 Tax=Aquimarina hainanensis TaxID=1578017 RepID=A0ABW5NB08_9FLAO
MKVYQNTLLIVFAFFAVYICWGATYILNKVIVEEIPPFYLAAFRFITAGISLLLLAKLIGVSLAISKKQLLHCTVAGFLFLTYGNGVLVWALKYVDSGLAALEVASQPLVVLILMRILYRSKIKPMSLIGIAMGIIGMYILVSQDRLTQQEGTWIPIFMIFTCVISWSYGSLYVAKVELPSNFLINTGYQMLLGGGGLLLTSFFFGESWTSPLIWKQSIAWAMFGLITLGSIIAFTSFNYLLKNVSAEKVATAAYVNPVIALFLGWYFLNEQITMQSSVAAFVLLTGVYFVNKSK